LGTVHHGGRSICDYRFSMVQRVPGKANHSLTKNLYPYESGTEDKYSVGFYSINYSGNRLAGIQI
jgi:hypothetical protein